MNHFGIRKIILIALVFAIFSLAFASMALAQDAKEIVKKSDALIRGLKSYSQIEMKIVRPSWKRTVVMDVWTEGTEKAFVRTLSPAKEKGITFLKIKREAWNYLPAVERIIKIPPSMMLQSWMGSDFTNDDMVKADSLVVDYTHKIVEEVEQDGTTQWKILLKPKENAAVVWGKVVLFVRKDNYVGTRCEYYNEDMQLVKYFETSDIKKIEGIHVPMKFSMVNVKKDGYRTLMTYKSLTFKPKFTPDTFTKKNLKSKGG